MPIFQKMRTVFGLGGEQSSPPSPSGMAELPLSADDPAQDIVLPDIGDWTDLARSFGRDGSRQGPGCLSGR